MTTTWHKQQPTFYLKIVKFQGNWIRTVEEVPHDLLTDQQTYTLITQLTNLPTINQPYMILFLFDWDMK